MGDVKTYNITRPSYNLAILDHRYAIMRDGTFIDLQTELSVKKDGLVSIDSYKVSYRSLLKKLFHKDNPKTLTLPLKSRANKLFEHEKKEVYNKLCLPYDMYSKYHDVSSTTYSRLRVQHGISCSKRISSDLPKECDIYGMRGRRYKDTCLYMTDCGLVFTKHTEGFKYRKHNNQNSEVRYVKDGKYKSVLYKKVKDEIWGK